MGVLESVSQASSAFTTFFRLLLRNLLSRLPTPICTKQKQCFSTAEKSTLPLTKVSKNRAFGLERTAAAIFDDLLKHSPARVALVEKGRFYFGGIPKERAFRDHFKNRGRPLTDFLCPRTRKEGKEIF